MVEWLENWDCDRHGLGPKPTCTILLCPWERHFMVLSSAWSSLIMLASSSKFQSYLCKTIEQQYLGISRSKSGNCLPFVSQQDKYRDKKCFNTIFRQF